MAGALCCGPACAADAEFAPAGPIWRFTADDTRRAELRATINRLLAAGHLGDAATKYRELLSEDPSPSQTTDASDDARADTLDPAISASVLAEQGQLDIASQLYSDGAHADAARAYELLIQCYPASSRANEVRLILGLLYTRHLDLPQRARELIEQAKPRLRQANLTSLADQLLAELA